MRVGRIFSKGNNSGFFQVVVENIFPAEATVVNFHFTKSKLGEKHFSSKKLIGKYQILKSRRSRPLARPSNAHTTTPGYGLLREKVTQPFPVRVSSHLVY